MHLPVRILLALAVYLLASSCSPKYAAFVSVYRNTPGDSAPDYHKLFYWAAHPDKHNPSDSVPDALQKDYQRDDKADVFFIYPTTFTDESNPAWNADINDAELNAKTDYSPILYQASAFNTYRIFAPRYRQAHIRAYFTTDSRRARDAFDLAYEDVSRAFRYYLEHYNNGRPIIIASHSQGSTHAQRLLHDFFDGQPLQKKLVAAYVIGMYIPSNAFKTIHACEDSTKTGCIIGWRTYRRNYEPDFIAKENNTSIVVNPLTWSTAAGFADHSLNKGSILLQFNSLKKKLVGAEIHDGMLWIRHIHLPAGFLIRRKNFHIGDINLFYVNIRNDVQRRVAIYNASSH